ncbi:protein DCL homolog, chloroplastic-like [Actinidia eriantha]|uniref:protein DCL homolog, chloroplastic-like n=1 Tax=Actinidia eriantha TaxID=165200 RepID=UPI00258F72AF|nr:protein DCL homolog, chloroplastic-like [Actinidia eriantha]
MAAPLLLRGFPLLRLRLHRIAAGLLTRRPWCTDAESTRRDEDVSFADQSAAVYGVKDPPQYPRWNDLDLRKWKDKEYEIVRDIEPITLLTKEILHSDRYMDGERLTAEDERAVVEKLLVYHPHSEDKIGCGLDSIIVDRHPEFRCSRCLFVVRTDGGWIDFSYHECLRAYIRRKYPSCAERFIKTTLNAENFYFKVLH